MESKIHIGQLNLRVSGKDDEAGRRLAEGIARKLAGEIPPGMRGRLGALNIRVPVAAAANEAEISAVTAEAVVEALRKGIPASGPER
jgi:hypothetical protein